VVNNLRDREEDERAGKRTLAVRIGAPATRIQYLLLVAIACGVPPLGIHLFGWPAWTLLGLGGLAFLAHPLTLVFTHGAARELNAALAWTARGVAWYAGMMAVGFLMG
jgi:1,4-dihydroxy-2-naphthoate octaprenyltransferase